MLSPTLWFCYAVQVRCVTLTPHLWWEMWIQCMVRLVKQNRLAWATTHTGEVGIHSLSKVALVHCTSCCLMYSCPKNTALDLNFLAALYFQLYCPNHASADVICSNCLHKILRLNIVLLLQLRTWNQTNIRAHVSFAE